MKSKRLFPFLAVILTVVLVIGASNVGAFPEEGPLYQITCGATNTCLTGAPAFFVDQNGGGDAIRGRTDSRRGSSRAAVRGIATYNANGVTGASQYGIGVSGSSTNDYGVYGVSDDLHGVYGESTGGGIADNGVYGRTNSTASNEAGVYGYSSGNAAGVHGYSSGGWGGYFEGPDENAPDIVLGGTSSSNDNGNIFSDPGLAGSDILLFSNDEVQVHLDENADEGAMFGVYNDVNQRVFAIDEAGDVYGNWGGTEFTAVYRTRDDFHIHLDDDNSGSNGVFRIYDESDGVAFWANTSGNGRFAGNLYVGGDLDVTGSKSSVVQASGEERSLYAMESPEAWFEDFGTGQLVNGQTTVTIEPTFAQTVNLGEAYHVFVTPLSGEPVLLFVSEKTTTAFTVRGVTLEGQPAEVSFDYRIVAKRLGYEELRLEPVEMAYPDGGPGAEAVPAASDVGDEEPTFGESIIINVTESEE